MCDGFGMIITKALEGFFCEPDVYGNCSHSKILIRLGMRDSGNQFFRNFVRIQCSDWTIELFEFDEEDTLPGWAEENRDQIINLVHNTLEKVYPVWDEFEKTRTIAWKKYNDDITYADIFSKQKEYNEIKKSAFKEYIKTYDMAWKLMLVEMSNIKGYVSKP